MRKRQLTSFMFTLAKFEHSQLKKASLDDEFENDYEENSQEEILEAAGIEEGSYISATEMSKMGVGFQR